MKNSTIIETTPEEVERINAAWKTLREENWCLKNQEHRNKGQLFIAYILCAISGFLVGVIATLTLMGF